MSVAVMGMVFRAPLRPAEKLLALALADFANDAGASIYPSIKLLCVRTSLSERSIQRALEGLRRSGLLVQVRRARHHSAAEYQINVAKLRLRGDTVTGDTVTGDPVTGDTLAKQGRHGDTQVVIEEPPGISIPPPSGSKEALFEAFWTAYPKKKSKADALRAWRTLKPCPDLVAQMLAALERQKGWQGWLADAGRFIPYGATWLRGQKWCDEPGPEDLASPRDPRARGGRPFAASSRSAAPRPSGGAGYDPNA